MGNYKVSLIIPCYNIDSIDFEEINPFNKMIDSVINQSFGKENYEILLVDDCSNDNTKNILTELENQFSNIRVIFLEENSGGPSVPRNIGIKNASADYVMFLDQDDYLVEDAIEKFYNIIIQNNVDIVKSNFSIFMDNKIQVHKNYFKDNEENIITVAPKSENLLYFLNLLFWGAIYRKDFLLENNIVFPNYHGEDIVFSYEGYCFTNKNILYLKDYSSVIYYSDNNNSLSHHFTFKKNEEDIKTFDYVLKLSSKEKLNKKFINKSFESFIIILIGSLLRSTESKDIKKKTIKSIKNFIERQDDLEIELPFIWKIFYNLIVNENVLLIVFASKFILYFFETSLFKKLFRNSAYE